MYVEEYEGKKYAIAEIRFKSRGNGKELVSYKPVEESAVVNGKWTSKKGVSYPCVDAKPQGRMFTRLPNGLVVLGKIRTPEEIAALQIKKRNERKAKKVRNLARKERDESKMYNLDKKYARKIKAVEKRKDAIADKKLLAVRRIHRIYAKRMIAIQSKERETMRSVLHRINESKANKKIPSILALRKEHIAARKALRAELKAKRMARRKAKSGVILQSVQQPQQAQTIQAVSSKA